MHPVKKLLLCAGLCGGGIFLVLQGEINDLKCDRIATQVNCQIRRSRWFPPSDTTVQIDQILQAAMESHSDDEGGGRVIVENATTAVPLTRDYVSSNDGRYKQIIQINEFIHSNQPTLRIRDYPLFVYLFGAGFLITGGLCWWSIPVSKTDRF